MDGTIDISHRMIARLLDWNRRMMHANPYEPPRHAKRDFTWKGVTLIPPLLATHTRKVVNRFGLFQVIWPLFCAYWTDSFAFDIWALLIATNGLRVTRASFKRFPWTALMLIVYPIAFAISLQSHNPLDIWNWLPSRSSPVLLLQLVSAAWAVYAIACICRCHFAQYRS